MTRWIAPFLVVLSAAGFLLVHPATRPDADRIYERAERAYLAGDAAGVESLCKRVLLHRPGHPGARSLLSEVEFVLGRRPFGPSDYGRLWESKFGIGRSQGIEIVLDRAERALAAADRASAEDDFRGALASLSLSRDADRKPIQTRRTLAGLRRLSGSIPRPRRPRGRPPPAC